MSKQFIDLFLDYPSMNISISGEAQVFVRYNNFMTPAVEITGTQLTNALRALNVNFIMGGHRTNETLHKQPARLIAALAKSNESRLPLSLIPLFLEHPEFALHVLTAAKKLDAAARLTLQCYYTAAVWLGKKYEQHGTLPDYFSQELGLHPINDPEDNLRALAKRHQELSGAWVNWLGTYLHAATVWQKGLQYKRV
jgi:hypothetical protein